MPIVQRLQLGAVLPLASEFPLNLPGYFYQEITARQFAVLSGQYDLRWMITATGL